MADPHRQIVAATPAAIGDAARLVRAGRLVAFPTETVYGLGADATNDAACASIFAAKGRPRFNPLIVHVLDREAAAAHVVVSELAAQLIERFWPGPLTLVLPRRSDCRLSLLVSAGLDTAAVRSPAHPVARDLLRAAGVPIAAPSANRSGEISPTAAEHVAASLGDAVDLILDGGPCTVGIESTVLDLSGAMPVLLRPGAVTGAALMEALGRELARGAPVAEDGRGLASPGMLARHYAPGRPVRLGAHERNPGEALLAFGPSAPSGDGVLNLSASGDLMEAAANLFRMLRALDRPQYSAIAVMPIPADGLGEAINDRLKRAATPA
ncbi:MAG: L-threonylcarbamoyladenylate synthase [Gemmatimonas sp.]